MQQADQSFVVAHMPIGVLIFAPAKREAALRMNQLLYWHTLVGAILLIAGILTGSIWAASSWGRYWAAASSAGCC